MRKKKNISIGDAFSILIHVPSTKIETLLFCNKKKKEKYLLK